jgi:hypothetical protein
VIRDILCLGRNLSPVKPSRFHYLTGRTYHRDDLIPGGMFMTEWPGVRERTLPAIKVICLCHV